MCQNLNEIYEASVKAIIRNIISMLSAVVMLPINNESRECARPEPPTGEQVAFA